MRLRGRMGQHRRANVGAAGIKRDGFAWHACREESLRHSPRCPGLLRARLEHEADMQCQYR